jgi:hypothetical protein
MHREMLPPHASVRVNTPDEAPLTLICFFDATAFSTTVMKRVGCGRSAGTAQQQLTALKQP